MEMEKWWGWKSGGDGKVMKIAKGQMLQTDTDVKVTEMSNCQSGR